MHVVSRPFQRKQWARPAVVLNEAIDAIVAHEAKQTLHDATENGVKRQE